MQAPEAKRLRQIAMLRYLVNHCARRKAMSLNASEEKVSRLARKTFLSMWSYENPFYEQGKELCDLLVIFANDVVIISDKLNQFGTHADFGVNWKRWYRKAVSASARQLWGARNHLRSFPDHIFVDAKVSSPLPLKLPPIELMRIHLVAVANGCDDACEDFSGRRGLTIDTKCNGDEDAFTVGCLGTGDDFVHIISTPALDALFDSFDTARDFIDYLDRKRSAMLDEDWVIQGEENLIGAYMMSQPGNRPFFVPSSTFPQINGARIVRAGIWDEYLTSEQRQARNKFWAKSYLIDQLIEGVAEDYVNERMLIGQDQPISYHERAFRLLAGESRLSRQGIAGAFYDIYREDDTTTFWGAVSESTDDPTICYVWLLYPEPPKEHTLEKIEHQLGVELSKYMLVAQGKFRHAKRIFGMCLPNRDCSLTTRIFRLIDGAHWTNEMAEVADLLEATEGIFSKIDQVKIASIR